MEKEFYSFEDFLKDINEFEETLKREEFSSIIAISRGGLTFAHFLSEKLNIRLVHSIGAISYNETERLSNIRIFDIPENVGQKVLIVDDIADSGRTLSEVLKRLKNSFQETEFKTATLFYKETSCFTPNLYKHKTKNWIDFFWNV
jgi:xanthine phosphoribosyltransferase